MQHIKKIYLYMVSLISLVILVIAAIILINMALKATVFKKADQANYYSPKIYCGAPAPATTATGEAVNYQVPPECSDPNYEENQKREEQESRSAQRQRDASQALAMILVATPVFLYHWKLARKEA